MAYRKDYNVNADDSIISAQSKLNAAGLINSTLENLWVDSYNAMAKGNLVLWNRKLDAVWNILGGDCKEGDEEDKKMAEINMSIYKTGSLNHSKTGFEAFEESKFETMALQYLLLNKKAIFLRRLQNKQGKGTAYANEDEDDFD
jgi:hypothetical protein